MSFGDAVVVWDGQVGDFFDDSVSSSTSNALLAADDNPALQAPLAFRRPLQLALPPACWPSLWMPLVLFGC